MKFEFPALVFVQENDYIYKKRFQFWKRRKNKINTILKIKNGALAWQKWVAKSKKSFSCTSSGVKKKGMPVTMYSCPCGVNSVLLSGNAAWFFGAKSWFLVSVENPTRQLYEPLPATKKNFKIGRAFGKVNFGRKFLRLAEGQFGFMSSERSGV